MNEHRRAIVIWITATLCVQRSAHRYCAPTGTRHERSRTMANSAQRTSHPMRRLLPGLLLLSSVVAVTAVVAHSEWETAEAAFDPQDLMHVPDADYRRDWVLLGSFSVLADDPEAGAKEFHVVYTQPENVDAYRKTGAFLDGAILVKDVFAANTEAMTTGTSSYANTLIGRF